MERLLKEGGDINENISKSRDSITPLLAAIAKEQFTAALILLQKGASVDPQFRGHSAYEFALKIGGGENIVVKWIEGQS